jgi:hypothetical protein
MLHVDEHLVAPRLGEAVPPVEFLCSVKPGGMESQGLSEVLCITNFSAEDDGPDTASLKFGKYHHLMKKHIISVLRGRDCPNGLALEIDDAKMELQDLGVKTDPLRNVIPQPEELGRGSYASRLSLYRNG